MGNLKTVIHAYRFNVTVPAEKAAYEELKEKLTALGLKCFETWGGSGGGHYMPQLDGKTIELETAHLFNDQWNSGPIEGFSEKGYRLFDWAQDYHSREIGKNPNIKQGHWLEQTAEMREIRRNTVGCGYCGKQEPAAKGYVFCPHCLDSQYLKQSELKLTRMVAIDHSDDRRPELTEAEAAYLLPLYKEAQTKGSTARGKARIAKIRADIEEKYSKATTNARMEHDGFMWMMNAELGPNLIDNCIFYTHTRRFSFGWRTPLGKEQESAVLDVISEFPFLYEIKTEDGRTLKNEE